MPQMADRGQSAAPAWLGMRPRRWYTAEVAPSGRRSMKLTARLWRYRSLVRRKEYDAASYYSAAVPLRKKKRLRRV